MFTTTLTREVTKSLPVAKGDVFRFDYPNSNIAASDLFPVLDVDVEGERVRCYSPVMKREAWYELSDFEQCTHLHNGQLETTVTITEPVLTVEHKFQVGDVIQYTGKHAFIKKARTITAIGFRPNGACKGEPFYFYNGDTESGDRVANVDRFDRYGATLVGGPRFVPPVVNKPHHYNVGDRICWNYSGTVYVVEALSGHYASDGEPLFDLRTEKAGTQWKGYAAPAKYTKLLPPLAPPKPLGTREALAELTDEEKDRILRDLAACLKHGWIKQGGAPIQWGSVERLQRLMGVK